MLPKTDKGRKTPKLLLQDHPDTKAYDTAPKKENYRSLSWNTYKQNAKYLQQSTNKRIQQHIKKIIHNDQVGFIPECKDSLIYTN